MENSSGDDSFLSWVKEITSSYVSLNNDSRNVLLEQLIVNSEQNQMEFLRKHLPPLACKDFITHLSLELITMILKYLSGRDILVCCQVCKSWRDRIYSLTDLWQAKAFEAGIDIETISEKYPEEEKMSSVYKTYFCLAEQFLNGLKQGVIRMKEIESIYVSGAFNKIHFTDDSIVVGEGNTVEIYSVPDMSLKHEVHTVFSLLSCYKYSLVFTHDYDGAAYSWNVETNSDLDRYDIYSSSEDDSIDVVPNRSMHKFVSDGTSRAIWEVDVTMVEGETFVITSSMSGLMKLWKIHPARRNAEMLTTLENVHSESAKVHFLPNDDHEKLKFFTFSRLDLFVWSLDVKTLKQEYCCASLPNESDDLISYCLEISNPESIFVTQWNPETKLSTMTSYCFCKSIVGFQQLKHWVLSEKEFRAHIVGVGSRFALLLCTGTLKDFQLFDLSTGCSLVTFASLCKFSTSVIKLYNTSWLNGFVFEEKDRMSTIIGPTKSFSNLQMLILGIPTVDDHFEDLKLNVQVKAEISFSESDYTESDEDESESNESD